MFRSGSNQIGFGHTPRSGPQLKKDTDSECFDQIQVFRPNPGLFFMNTYKQEPDPESSYMWMIRLQVLSPDPTIQTESEPFYKPDPDPQHWLH